MIVLPAQLSHGGKLEKPLHHHFILGRPTYNVIQHSTAQHNTTQHNTTQHNTTQHNTAQHSTTQHNTTQHNTTQHNTHLVNCCLWRECNCVTEKNRKILSAVWVMEISHWSCANGECVQSAVLRGQSARNYALARVVWWPTNELNELGELARVASRRVGGSGRLWNRWLLSRVTRTLNDTVAVYRPHEALASSSQRHRRMTQVSVFIVSLDG